MTRLCWGGAESGNLRGDGNEVAVSVVAPAVDATIAHSGLYSYKVTAAGSGMRAATTAVDGRWLYARCWFRFDALPTITTDILRWYVNNNSSSMSADVRLQSDGKLLYEFLGGFSQLSPAVSVNTWVCVEFAVRGRVGIGYDGIFRFNGVTLGTPMFTSNTGVTLTTIPDACRFGYLGALSSPLTTVWLDDIALNDDSGSSQNSWPGTDGKIVHLVPVSDSAVGSDWKSNTLTAFSPGAYDCLNNRPIVNNAFGTGGAQIQTRDNVANVTAPASNLDVTTEPYSTYLGSGDEVKLCQHRFFIGDSSGTNQPQVAGQITSNPAEASETVYTSLVAAATTALNSGWKEGFGPILSQPSVNKANGAVLRTGKRTASTDSVGCCYAALQVEYGPSTAPTGFRRFLAVA
jgi:hypothetical protein